jgi:hypothetical protein
MSAQNSKIDPYIREMRENIDWLTRKVDLLLLQDWQNPEMERFISATRLKKTREQNEQEAQAKYIDLQDQMQRLIEDFPNLKVEKHERSS